MLGTRKQKERKGSPCSFFIYVVATPNNHLCCLLQGAHGACGDMQVKNDITNNIFAIPRWVLGVWPFAVSHVITLLAFSHILMKSNWSDLHWPLNELLKCNLFPQIGHFDAILATSCPFEAMSSEFISTFNTLAIALERLI